MVLVRVECPNPCLPDEFTLVYACSKCGTDLHDYKKHRAIKDNVCPICGHVLDKEGKPSRYPKGDGFLSCKEVAEKFSDDARYQSRLDFWNGLMGEKEHWYEIFMWKIKGYGKYGNFAYPVTKEVMQKLNDEGYRPFHKRHWDEYFKEQAEIAVAQAKQMVV